MALTRRDVVRASAAITLMMPWAMRARAAPLPRDVDIVVIGAGAAGIAAARRIAAAGRSVVVVEASDRIGGRCHTDTGTFDVRFERGAQWLHGPATNPLVKQAPAAGITLAPSPQGQKIRIGRRNARAGEAETFLAALVRANRAIEVASRAKADISCMAALPADLGEWAGAVHFVLGVMRTSKDLDQVSARDRARMQERLTSVFCRQGLGPFLAELGASVPVVLSSPVTQVNWGGRGVSVETPAGKIAARAVIVTVSTGVLGAEAIRFAPALPARQLDAIAKLSLGSYERIVLELPGNPLGLARDDIVIERSANRDTGLLFANIEGSALCAVDVGGTFGRDLAAQGEAAMTGFATEWLGGLFGGDVASRVKRSTATRWDADPYIRGAVSASVPDGQPARKVLMEPAQNLLFAGEAAHETLWGTVGGAWESGERAADAALKLAVRQPVAAKRRSKTRPKRAP